MLLLRQNSLTFEILRSQVRLKHDGSVKKTEQAFVKREGQWYPVFDTALSARWGLASYAGPMFSQNGYMGPQSFIEMHLTNFLDKSEFSFTKGPDQFAYFAIPKSFGQVRFTEKDSAFYGGWDGVKWNKEQDMTSAPEGPVEVEFDNGEGPETWLVYRTDWPGSSQDNLEETWIVEYF